MQHFRVEHAEAARGLRLADRLHIIGAVYAIERITEVERHSAQRIADATSHLLGQFRIALAHLCRRIPVGPGLLAAYSFCARPIEAFTSDRDGVSVCAT